MKRIGLLTALLIVSLGVISVANPYLKQQLTNLGTSSSKLEKFGSYDEFRAFMNARATYTISGVYDFLGGPIYPSAIATPSATERASLVTSYSSTNIQVEGVDEADIVKTDGRFLYLVSNSHVFIVKAYPPEEAAILSRIEVNGSVLGLFVDKDRLALFLGGFPYLAYDCINCGLASRALPPQPFADGNTTIQVYDITDRTQPKLSSKVSVIGTYVNSRMIGDYLYVVVNAIANAEQLPEMSVNDRTMEIPATEVYHSDITDYGYFFTTVIAINIQDHAEAPTFTTILTGATSTIYVSTESIYLTMAQYNPEPLPSPSTQPRVEETVIHRLEIKGGDVEPAASGSVAGHVLNQFSMDEYKNDFRIATTVGWGQGWKNSLNILNMDLKVVGQIEDMAPGESIYSVRFMGDRAYVVTFKKIDPLFAIDVSDPSNPTILGQLKIPGYSSYLHPYDENHLIGIGKDAFPSEEGNFAWYQGLKISLFEVSELSRPKEMANLILGDRGSDSPILYDHKALLFDRERSILVIPVLLAEIARDKYSGDLPPYTQGEYVFQGAYIFTVSPDSGIVVRGRITHLPDNGDLLRSGDYFDSSYAVKRSLYVGNVLYTVSDKKVMMNDITTLQRINEVDLTS